MSKKGNLVLVAEDDAAISEALQEALEGEGYQVLAARTGLEALRFLESGHRPQLILLDVMMPEMTGYEFLTNFRLRDDWKEIPVALLSADGRLDQAASSHQVKYFLKKPLDITDLFDLVECFCDPAKRHYGEQFPAPDARLL